MSINSRDSRHEGPGAPEQCSAIRLLDADPDLARFLSAEEHRAADRLALPVRSVPGDDDDVSALIEDAKAFGALVLDGMLAHRVRIGDHPALRLLGPGDVFWLGGETATTLLADSRCSAIAATSLALLDANFLIATHRSPRIVRGLAAGMAEQSERAAAQLAISQLPRVDQRLMAIMWLLAEKWGDVTRAGTVLPLALTHVTLGYLIGARRSTVTLALGELAERGRLVKQDDGWLIIEPPPGTTRSTRQLDVPQVVRFPPSRSEGEEQPSRDQHQPSAAVRARTTIVREENPGLRPSTDTESGSGGSVSQPVIAGELAIIRQRLNDALVLALHGELDLASAPLLERELLDAESGRPGRIVVDLSGLQFMDSAGLHVLVRAHERARENDHQLLLRRGPRAVHRVFEITGTLDAFAFEN